MCAIRPILIPLTFISLSLLLFLQADHPDFFFDSAGDAIANETNADLGRAWKTYTPKLLHLGPNALGHLSLAFTAGLNRLLGYPAFDPTGFIGVNALLPGLNAWLVLLLIGQLNPELPGRYRILLAGLFLVQPLQLNSVAYAMQQRGILSSVFYLLSVLLYLRSGRSNMRR